MILSDSELVEMLREPRTRREGFAVLVKQYSENYTGRCVVSCSVIKMLMMFFRMYSSRFGVICRIFRESLRFLLGFIVLLSMNHSIF